MLDELLGIEESHGADAEDGATRDECQVKQPSFPSNAAEQIHHNLTNNTVQQKTALPLGSFFAKKIAEKKKSTFAFEIEANKLFGSYNSSKFYIVYQ